MAEETLAKNLDITFDNTDKEAVLSARDIIVEFTVRDRVLTAIRNVSLDLYDGETLAIVGESGSGKSVFTKTFTGMLEKNGNIPQGKIIFEGRNLLENTSDKDWEQIRGKKIATIRSREISASIILQAQSQLKAIYKDNADTIVGNCDSTLFLGGKEKTTLKELSETLGKETIDLYNTSETRSNQKSFGLNYQKTGKELMSQDEITVMDGSKCIFQLRGVRPFLSDKFDITKHKNYKFLEDYDKKNVFDIEEYIKRKGKVKLNRNTVITRL